MGRGKLPLRLIEKERARRITCIKRKKGLMKKAYELSTLCDVRVCMIVYDPAAEDQQAPIKTYPEDPALVDRILDDYRTYKLQNPSGSKRRDLNLADFYNDRVKRLKAETEKLFVNDVDNRVEFSVWDPRIDQLSESQLLELLVHLDGRIEHVNGLIAERTAMAIVPVSHNSNNNHDHQGLGFYNNDHHFHDHIPSSSSNNNAAGFDDQHVANANWAAMHYYTNLLEAPDYHSYSMDQHPHQADQMVVQQQQQQQPGYPSMAAVDSAGNNLYFPIGMEQYYHFQAPPPPLAVIGSGDQFYGGGSQQEVKFYVNNEHHHLGFGRLPGV